MKIQIDRDFVHSEHRADHERAVLYGRVFVVTQLYNDPNCTIERQQAVDGAVSLLRYHLERMSHHERLEFYAATKNLADRPRTATN